LANENSQDSGFLRQGGGKGLAGAVLAHLKAYLQGKVVILGIGNTLRSDDGAGSILASRLKGRVGYSVYDAGVSPENYLGKIIKERPKNIIIIDAFDCGLKPGEFRVLEPEDIKSVNFFSTHNASLALTINYLQNNLQADIIILGIQPKQLSFGGMISPEVEKTLEQLEVWFSDAQKKR
jgi:hydrogenase 3 maturation protease